MALKALSIDKVKTYESKLDTEKGTENATVFQIKALSARQAAKIRDKSTKFAADGQGETTVTMEMNTANVEFVRYGLKGWTNFKDEAGNLVEFKSTKDKDEVECVHEDCLNLLPSDLIQELSQEIQGFNNLSETERKN